MLFREIILMAWSSLGSNKLRSALTMLGITIGVFSVISVMTAIGALQNSIESGISFLGSNIFQFAKYPVNVDAGGETKKKFQNRRNITYRQALRYYELMQGDLWAGSKRAGSLQWGEDSPKSYRRRHEWKFSYGQCLYSRIWTQLERRGR